MKRLPPFVGVACVGAGVNKQGQQDCAMIRAGEMEIAGGKPLTSLEMLQFITDLDGPGNPAFVTYHLAYLATHVLRDMPTERLTNRGKHGLFDEKPTGEISRYTKWNKFGVEYLPGNYLRVCRYEREPVTDPETGLIWYREKRVEDSQRTITDVSALFRAPLARALEVFGVGAGHRETLALARATALDLTKLTREAADACRIETALLAELMERFRQLCHDAGLKPRFWSGPGKLADWLHKENKTVTAAWLAGLTTAEVRAASRRAFYGGRFEVTRVGEVAGPIIENDIRGAYPAAMRELPCLTHATWTTLGPRDFAGLPDDALFIADVAFSHPPDQFLCGLPIRKRENISVIYPREGSGTYWSRELWSAERLGARIEYKRGWLCASGCDCRPFKWIDDLYRRRQAFGTMLEGETIKTAMASLYGKLIQRRGTARYENFVWGSLVTAIVRSWLNDAIARDPANVIMLATDAVFSKTPLALPRGPGLGQWDRITHDRVFIVQPGLWWGAGRTRTRGVALNLFEPHAAKFEADWNKWRGMLLAGSDLISIDKPPVVFVPLRLFTGLRLAFVRATAHASATGEPLPLMLGEAARIVDDGEGRGRAYAFQWGHKRGHPRWEENAIVTRPLLSGELSLGFDEAAEIAAELEAGRLEVEAMPDTLDMGIPFR